MEVVPGLYWVEEIWDTKVYVWLEGERVVLIDAATPGQAGAVWKSLRRLGYPPEALAEIWLTHGDFDHVGSAAALKARSGARVVAHRDDVRLVQGQARRALGAIPFRSAWERLSNWAIDRVMRGRAAHVDRTVEDGDALGAWRVVHVPGHTAGSVCYYHPERKIIVVGDAINHRRGRLGAPPRSLSVDAEQAITSVHKIAALDFEVCCFGHGAPIVGHASQRVAEWARSLPRPLAAVRVPAA